MASANAKAKDAERRERVVLYARISEDTAGEGAGVARQMEDLRSLAKVRGWQVAGEIADNNISAFTGRARPGYKQVLAMVTGREVDRVAVWHMSRLWRNRSERARGLESFRESGVSIAAVRGPEIDLSSASGRMVAGMLGEFDTYESDLKSERVARASEQRAAEGRANGAVQYGYRKTKGARPGVLEPDPVEAREVRGMVAHLLEGWSLKAVCDDLDRRNVPRAGGAVRWYPSGVTKVVKRPANAGLRQFRGDVIGKADWPPIVDESDWHRLVLLLADPDRKSNVENLSERKHLLTYGLGECGVCGGRLRIARLGAKKVPTYVCEAKQCTGRNQRYVDEMVTEAVLTYLARPENRAAAMVSLDPATDEDDVETLRSRLDAAVEAYASGALDLDTLTRVRSAIEERVAAAGKRMSVPVDRRDLELLLGADDIKQTWSDLDVKNRRAVLDALWERVCILPTTRRGSGFDPNSVTIKWRNSASK